MSVPITPFSLVTNNIQIWREGSSIHFSSQPLRCLLNHNLRKIRQNSCSPTLVLIVFPKRLATKAHSCDVRRGYVPYLGFEGLLSLLQLPLSCCKGSLILQTRTSGHLVYGGIVLQIKQTKTLKKSHTQLVICLCIESGSHCAEILP